MAKSKYESNVKDKLILVQGWARDGLTMEQIAHNLGISKETLYQYKRKYVDLSDALKKGKEVIDIEVENALLKKALGYKSKEIIKERLIDTGQKKRHGGESKLTEDEWEFSIKYFDNKCCYCGRELVEATKDHIIPLHKGGKLVKENVIPCCRTCNSKKSDNDMEKWYKNEPYFNEYRLMKIKDYIKFVSKMESQDSDLVVTKEVIKEVAPDTASQIFWLKNRQPKKWRNGENNSFSEKEKLTFKQKLELEKLKIEKRKVEILEKQYQETDDDIEYVIEDESNEKEKS